MEEVNFEPLNLLLKASSKNVVLQLCNEAFINRNCVRIPSTVAENASNLLGGADYAASLELLNSLRALIKNAVFQGSTDPQDVVALFPADFHKNLRDLLARILIDQIPNWRTHSLNNLVSLPRLVDFDWRVDVKTSSDSIARMAVPTCLLQLQVQEGCTEVGKMSDVSRVDVELSKQTLDTMLDGLGKIRNQLDTVANTSS